MHAQNHFLSFDRKVDALVEFDYCIRHRRLFAVAECVWRLQRPCLSSRTGSTATGVCAKMSQGPIKITQNHWKSYERLLSENMGWHSNHSDLMSDMSDDARLGLRAEQKICFAFAPPCALGGCLVTLPNGRCHVSEAEKLELLSCLWLRSVRRSGARRDIKDLLAWEKSGQSGASLRNSSTGVSV
eukprot:s203_g32.t1